MKKRRKIYNSPFKNNGKKYEFHRLNAKNLQMLAESGLVDLEGRWNAGPKLKELYEFSKKHTLFLYAGTMYNHRKEKSQLSVNSVYIPSIFCYFEDMSEEKYFRMKKDFLN